ncbi:MAG: hypothetical protein KDC84_10100 [Crocinitomicaceae bacterium]|nr:hypothetical protein [Crocinitomicaceae bacterium]
MKKSVLLFFALTLSFFLNAQDLSVIFDIKVVKAPKDVKKALKQVDESDFIMKFSGNKSYSKINLFGMFTQTIVFDSDSGEGFILMDISAQKILIKVNREQLNEYNKGKDIKPIVEEVKGTKKVLDHDCNKALLKYSDGKEYTVYYSKAIKYKHENFDYLDGFPLDYSTEQNNMVLTMTASAVDQKTKVDANLFEIPSGYTEISFEKLMELQQK